MKFGMLMCYNMYIMPIILISFSDQICGCYGNGNSEKYGKISVFGNNLKTSSHIQLKFSMEASENVVKHFGN